MIKRPESIGQAHRILLQMECEISDLKIELKKARQRNAELYEVHRNKTDQHEKRIGELETEMTDLLVS